MSSSSRGCTSHILITFVITALFVRTSYQACDPNCANGCSNTGDGKCDGICISNLYRFNSTLNKCIPCSAHCLDGCGAKGDYSCNECIYGYGLDIGTPRTCQPCDPNCDTKCMLAGAAKCDGFCKNGYTFNGITKRCDGGGSGTGSTTTQRPTAPSSTQCSAHCTYGCKDRGPGSCDQCDTNYGLNNAAKPTCGACDSHCTNGCQQKGADRCDGGCMSGYTYDSPTALCKPSVNQPGTSIAPGNTYGSGSSSNANLLLTGLIAGLLVMVQQLL